MYVAAILFSRSTLHRETLPCLPNNTVGKHQVSCALANNNWVASRGRPVLFKWWSSWQLSIFCQRDIIMNSSYITYFSFSRFSFSGVNLNSEQCEHVCISLMYTGTSLAVASCLRSQNLTALIAWFQWRNLWILGK